MLLTQLGVDILTYYPLNTKMKNHLLDFPILTCKFTKIQEKKFKLDV